MSQSPVRFDAPYKGLAPFTASDAPFFFGRDLERNYIIANLRGVRLTLLYGASGVGKSSLLQAGVVPALRRVARESREEYGLPEIAVALLDHWRGDPRRDLLDAIATGVTEACGGVAFEPLPEDLTVAEAIRTWAKRLKGTILVLLDQFEGYLAGPPQRGDTSFDRQLAAAINDSDLDVGFLVSLQQEALGGLDRLTGLIPRIFANSVRLEHLDREGARQAIKGPLATWNRILQLPACEEFYANDDLVDAIRNDPDLRRMAVTPVPSETEDAPHRIDTTYLQFVLSRLWDEEVRRGSRELRSGTLADMGGARNVVRRHVDEILCAVPYEVSRAAGALLGHLVTPGGDQAARTVGDLAGYANLPIEVAQRALDALAAPAARIVRHVTDENGVVRYEVFHDVLILAILSWQEDARRKETEKARRRLLQHVGLSVALLFIGMLVVGWMLALRRSARTAQYEQVARAKRLSTQAGSVQSERFDLSLLLCLQAYETRQDAKSLEALVTSLKDPRSQGEFVGWAGGPVLAIASRRDGVDALETATDRLLQGWLSGSRRAIGAVAILDREPVSQVVFSRDGKTVGAIAADGVVRFWSAGEAPLPIVSVQTSSATVPTAIALSIDGRRVALGSPDGTVDVWSVHPMGRIARSNVGAGSVEALDFSPDQKHLAVGLSDGAISILSSSLSSRRQIRTGGARISSLAFDTTGRFLAAGGTEGTVQIWSVPDRKPLGKAFTASGGTVWSVSFSPDTQTVAAGMEDGSVHLWSTFLGGAAVKLFQGHPRRVRAIAFAPDGLSILSGQDDGSIRRWRTGTTADPEASLGDLGLSSLRARICRVANRNLSPDEWAQFVGSDVPYHKACPSLPAGAEGD